jgi:hypothetical protein
VIAMSRAVRPSLLLAAIAIGIATFGGSLSRADDAPPFSPPAPAPPPTATEPAPSPAAAADRAAGTAAKSFPTPEEASNALFAAFEANDDEALRAIVGDGNEDLVQDGKDPAVAAQRRELAKAAKAKLTLDRDEKSGRVVLVVGEVEHPLAISLVKAEDGWRVDADAGRTELLARRIGENELEAVGIALAYADAQVVYASADRDGDEVKEYAQRIVSTPGAKDGLHWDATNGDDDSPVGSELAPLKDALEPTAVPKPPPFNGYYWRILKAQGANAPGGAHSYVINGNMIAGFGLLGVPAVHRNTGVMSILVSHHGKVFEKDLGADTLKAAAAIEAFDPDASWRAVDARTLADAADSSPADAAFLEDTLGRTDEPVSPATPTSGVPAPGTVPAARPAGAMPADGRCPGK